MGDGRTILSYRTLVVIVIITVDILMVKLKQLKLSALSFSPLKKKNAHYLP